MMTMRAFALVMVVLAACDSGTIEGADDTATDGGTDESTDEMSDEAPLPDAPEPRVVDITGPDVLPHVQAFANHLCTQTGACSMGTRVGHSPTADRAVDILVSDAYGEVPTDDYVLGDTVAQLVLDELETPTEFGVMYVIWRQRYNDGRGWDPMEDRGSITANHYDHVHISFEVAP